MLGRGEVPLADARHLMTAGEVVEHEAELVQRPTEATAKLIQRVPRVPAHEPRNDLHTTRDEIG